MRTRKSRTRYLLSTVLVSTIAVLTSLVVAPASFAAPVVGDDGLVVDITPAQVEEADADGFTLTITDDNLSGAVFDSYQVSGLPTGWSVVVDGAAAEIISPDPLIYSVPRTHTELRIVAPADYVGTLSGVKIARDSNGPNLVTDFDSGTFDYLGQSFPELPAASTPYEYHNPTTGGTGYCNVAGQWAPCDGAYTVWPTASMNGPGTNHNNRWADLRSSTNMMPDSGATLSTLVCGPNPLVNPTTNDFQLTSVQSAAYGKILVVNGSSELPVPHDLITTTITGLEPGATYSVSANIANVSYDPGTTQPVQSAFYMTDSEETKIIGSSLPLDKQSTPTNPTDGSACLNQNTVWGQNSGTFVADPLGTATIGLRNYAGGGFGNDLAVDNLALVKMASVSFDLEVFETPEPAIALDKDYLVVDDVNGNGINDPGDVIVWTFDVTNTGNVPLENVTVDDPLLQDLGIAIICDPAPVAPGESVLCRSEEYTITDADAEAGEIRNVATATGEVPPGTPGEPENPVSPPDEVVIPIDPTPVPGISLDKDWVMVDDANDNGINDPGDVIKWTFAVTNTGNVPLDNVRIDDPLLDGLGVAITCDPTSLAAGESAVCESENYTITQADARAGEIHNVATATGEVPPGTPGDPEDPVSPPDEVTIPLVPLVAGLELVKSAHLNDTNGNGWADAGETIDYSFELTSTGTAELTDVFVDDPMLAAAGIAIECPQTTLAPGESMTCHADKGYTVTKKDVANGAVHNVATGHATVPEGVDPIVPPTSETTTPANEVTYLASTGGSNLGLIGGAAALLVLAGGVLLVARRMKNQVITL